MKKSSYDDIDTPRERLFGWFPRKKSQAVFLVLNFVFFALCFALWPYMPVFRVGLMPSPFIWYLTFTAVGLTMWGIYLKKYWYGDDDSEE